MLKSKLLVPVVLCAVVAFTTANAYGPQDDNKAKAPPVETDAVSSRASVEASISFVPAKVQERRLRFTNVAMNETPENRWMLEMMSKPVPALDYPGENPLSEILDEIEAYYTLKFGKGAGPDGGDLRLAVYPDLAELDLEGVTSLEEITIRDINVEGITLRNALQLIFWQTSDPELTWVIENQVMKVTTLAKAKSEDNLCTRVYNVGELGHLQYRDRRGADPGPRVFKAPAAAAQAAPKRGGVGFFSVPQFSEAAEAAVPVEDKVIPRFSGDNSDLESLVMEMTAPPARWMAVDGEGGAIRLIGNTLVVRQTAAVQAQVVDLLNLLDLSENGGQ